MKVGLFLEKLAVVPDGGSDTMRSEHGRDGKEACVEGSQGLSWLVSKKGRKDGGSKAQTHTNSPAGEGDAAR